MHPEPKSRDKAFDLVCRNPLDLPATTLDHDILPTLERGGTTSNRAFTTIWRASHVVTGKSGEVSFVGVVSHVVYLLTEIMNYI
jgi:hypothetical protein